MFTASEPALGLDGPSLHAEAPITPSSVTVLHTPLRSGGKPALMPRVLIRRINIADSGSEVQFRFGVDMRWCTFHAIGYPRSVFA
jgi:hypothetical protein